MEGTVIESWDVSKKEVNKILRSLGLKTPCSCAWKEECKKARAVFALKNRENKGNDPRAKPCLNLNLSGCGTKKTEWREAVHMIIVAGPKKACRDALIGANLLKMDFAMSNVLVVPFETGVDQAELQSRPTGGFGEGPSYENQPYVARVVGDGWDEYIQEEINDALEQNGESIKEDGIAIVIANNGKVIRRGVGKVPWRQMVDQLEKEVSLGTS